MKKKFVYIILGLILVVGIILRLYQLGSVPPSPDWDEVALGYDAYSISITGRDEFGKFLPVVLRSFDDYKPALYSYLIIPTYKIFGLNTYAVRLPSAIFGILTILAVYFLVRKLFDRQDLALLTSFLLAISPWHIQFSRLGFEANVGLGFNIFAAVFFLYGLRKRYWMLTLSTIFAALSIYTYQSEKVFTPLLILGLVLIYAKPLLRVPKKYLSMAFIVGLIAVTPMIVYIITDKQALLRAKGTSVFNSQTEILKRNAQKNVYNLKVNNKLGKIVDNRRIVYTKTIISGYLSHYNPNWLLNGDIARHHAPDMGLIYIWEFPFILIGVYILLFGKFDTRSKIFVFFWFLLAPLPASITTGVPHAVRTLNFLPTWSVFVAIGLLTACAFVSSIKYQVLSINPKIIKTFLFSVFCFLFILNFAYYLNQYFVQLNYYDADQWQYGYQQAIAKEQSLDKLNHYQKIIISDTAPMDKSYMFFLFYTKYNPLKYQKSGEKSGGFAVHQKFDKYEFRPINWSKDSSLKNTLFIGLPSEIPQSARIYTVNFPNGKPAMVVAVR